MNNLDLENDKIVKLIRKFSIPCVISMVVAALYNIVDQIFIGWSNAGAFGNAATNIVYPFTVIALAFALIIGDGAAANFSLAQGEKNNKKGNLSIGNSITMLVIVSLLLMIIGLVFDRNILKIFGANKDEILCYNYAKDYLRIITIGLPFYIIGQGLNASIRSDGSPKYAMFATLAGAIFNIIFDPIFIFVFNMEVKGAALATILGQVLTFIITIFYLVKPKIFKIERENLKLNRNVVGKILSLGLASFITQIAIVIIITVANNLVSRYGYQTLSSTGDSYGVVIPLAIIGICMKVFGIIISIVIGVSLGGQPIIGYNKGAGNINRVKETCKKILFINFIIGLIGFFLIELAPDLIISIFGNSNSTMYMEYARYCLRIFLSGIVFTSLIKSTSILLQSMGSSFKSTVLALSRDVIFFVPAITIIASISGSVVTMLWSSLIADILSFITAIILLKIEFKKLEETNENDLIIEDINQDSYKKPITDKPILLTISREYASGGHFVGELLAKEMGIKFFDKEIINMTAKEYGFSKKFILENEQKNIPNSYYKEDNELFNSEAKVIRKIASSEKQAIIVGRCSNYILRDNPNLIKIFLYSDTKSKIDRCVKYYGIKAENALKEINKINKIRKRHYKYFTEEDWDNLENYDLAINVDVLGVEKTALLIKDYILNKK